jgi:hypothetical protein
VAPGETKLRQLRRQKVAEGIRFTFLEDDVAYIPENPRWYLAELVLEITVEGDKRNVVHQNLTLVRASSENDAFALASQLGIESETQFENPAGNAVRIVFRGIGRLNVIYDKLEHGAELCFDEKIGVPEDEIKQMIPARESLSIFRKIESSAGPDYSSREILGEVSERITNSD